MNEICNRERLLKSTGFELQQPTRGERPKNSGREEREYLKPWKRNIFYADAKKVASKSPSGTGLPITCGALLRILWLPTIAPVTWMMDLGPAI